MVDRLADAMHAYWEAALADDWPQLRAVLEGEMLGRARALGALGPGGGARGAASERALAPPGHRARQGQGVRHAPRGRPLVLIPLVFARGVLMGVSEEQRAVALGYQARGTAALWAPSEVGATGASTSSSATAAPTVLRALDRPATTTELARRLSYAPSTVSAHLDVLARAGLVDRHRVRRSVFYGLNETGSSLVALLADIPEVLSA